MLPTVALIGRSNVGKSTLFNRLTQSYDAIVANSFRLTRDRNYGLVKVEGYEFVCIDTGGIDGIKDNAETSMVEQQSLLAIKEANVVFFIVDARIGLMPTDSFIAKHLRLCEKPVFLVANKIDSIDFSQIVSDFWLLGFGEIYPISASHGRGVTKLLRAVLSFFVKKINLSKEMNENISYWRKFKGDKKDQDSKLSKNSFNLQNLPIKLAIVGRPNVGKSTLINRLLGKERVVVCDIPGTTRDSIYIPMRYDNHEYVLVDTAGVRKRRKIIDVVEKFSVVKTLQAIEEANVVLLVIDAHQGISDQDLSLLNFILKSGRSLIIIINKWDNLKNKTKKKIKEVLSYRLDFVYFARIHFISALYGNDFEDLFESVQEAYDNSIRHHSATILTRIMNMATEDHRPPLLQGGRRVKFKYAHVGGYNPPILVIHGNQVKNLSNSYKRYLVNYFRKSLEIMGTPIFLRFKEKEKQIF